MTTVTVNNTRSVSASRRDVAATARAPRRGLLARVWDGLAAYGEGRARSELARHIWVHGGRPTGRLAEDARQVAALRNMG